MSRPDNSLFEDAFQRGHEGGHGDMNFEEAVVFRIVSQEGRAIDNGRDAKDELEGIVPACSTSPNRSP